jgi:hypothetical protein
MITNVKCTQQRHLGKLRRAGERENEISKGVFDSNSLLYVRMRMGERFSSDHSQTGHWAISPGHDEG